MKKPLKKPSSAAIPVQVMFRPETHTDIDTLCTMWGDHNRSSVVRRALRECIAAELRKRDSYPAPHVPREFLGTYVDEGR
jgi:Arc/MetJ-type ribon-helix-helix transcriptional regulator